MKVTTTGYFPPPPGGYKNNKEAKMEGGALDCFGNKLRTLQEFAMQSYVSLAVDPKIIPLKKYITIDGFPNIIFYSCDVGSAIKGKHVDICVANEKESYKIEGEHELTIHDSYPA